MAKSITPTEFFGEGTPNHLVTSPATVFIADATNAVITLASTLRANQIAPGTYTGMVKFSATDEYGEIEIKTKKVGGVVPSAGGTFDLGLGDLSDLVEAKHVTMDAYLVADNSPSGSELMTITITAAVALVLPNF